LAVGEARAEEIQDMVTAAAIGHGTATTLHTDSLDHMVGRLMSHPMNLRADQLALIDYVVFIARRPDGRRQITAIYENRGGKWEGIYEPGKELKTPIKILRKLSLIHKGLEVEEVFEFELRRRAEVLRSQARAEVIAVA